LIYLKAGEDEGIGLVCQACAADRTDQELEAKVLGSLDRGAAPPLAAELEAAAPPLDWVEKAALSWVGYRPANVDAEASP
jgi:hypothetical protein